MIKSRRFLILIFLFISSLSIQSCLTCEKKEYVFQITGANSGRLTIKYVNIFSSLIDSAGEVEADYEELISMWLKGEKIERDFPEAKIIKKRLFDENGMLCGEIVLEFDNLLKAGIYRYMNSGPYMFSLSSVNDDGENFLQTNGEYGGEKMPVLFWPEDFNTLRFSTKISPSDSTSVSLLSMWERKGTKGISPVK